LSQRQGVDVTGAVVSEQERSVLGIKAKPGAECASEGLGARVSVNRMVVLSELAYQQLQTFATVADTLSNRLQVMQ
jgi:hypothetical protein